MTTEEGTGPEQLERFLSNREGAGAVDPGELRPRHLVAVATTTDDGLAALDDSFDWQRLLATLSDLDEDEQSRWIRRLIRNLGTRTAAGIDSEEGIKALGERGYELRHDHPEVFITYLDEIQSLLRYDTSSAGIAAAEDEFKRLAEIGDRESDERVAAFREQDIEQRLVDPNLGAESRISLLETLAEERVEDVPTRMVIDVLYPLRNHYDAAVEQAALETYETWAKQLTKEQSASETIETLEGDLANEIDELPASIIRGIVMSGYIAPAIVDWMVALPRIETRQEVVQAAFETLQHVPGMRDAMDDLCPFLLDAAHDDETVMAGIDVLESVLVGLEPRQNTDNPAQDDHIQAVFFTDEELRVDETIRSTLQQLVEASGRSEEVRARAAEAWLSVRPPEIQRVLWEIDADDVGDSAVTEAKLQAAADHRLIEFVDVADDLWAAADGDTETRHRLVQTLENLESREIVDVLLDPAFDADDAELRTAAREALIDSGYESEIDREAQRRTILDRISTRFDAMSTATDIDREIRDRNEEQNSTEEQRKQAGVKAAEAASKSVDNLTSFRSEGATQMLKLAPLFDQLKELEKKIRDLVSRIDSLCAEIEQMRDEAERIEREIKDVEHDIDSTEADLENAREEKAEVKERIAELDRKIIPEIREKIGKLEKEYKRVERKEPSKLDFSGENAQQQYQNAMRQWKQELDNIEGEIDTLHDDKRKANSELSELEARIPQIEDDISSYESRLRDLRDRHRGLAKELDESNQQIDGYQQQLEQLRNELRGLREEYERIQSQVDDIVTRLDGIRQSARSRESKLQQRGEQFRSRVGSLRESLEALAAEQSSALDRRERQAERVSDLADQLDDDHDDFEDIGERTKAEVPAADVAAAELADETRKQQYEANETEWRLDSIFRRTHEADRIEALDPDLADRAAERVTGGDSS